MKSITDTLEQRISQAIGKVTGQKGCPALVSVSKNPKFGDYQVNGVMAAAKKMKTNPRQLAEQIVEELDLDDICQPPEIAGPGFINLRLKDEFVAGRLLEINSDKDRLGIEKVKMPKTVVVDYSGPNIAKQMHVGHLRSTIIGDCISRMVEFEGHIVVRQNHIGDWGTQFGMLIALLKEQYPDILENPGSVEIADLEGFYQEAKAKSDNNEAFTQTARDEVVKLHNHDKDTITIWQHIVDESRKHYLPIYQQLSVTLNTKDERGESFYADKLADVVEQLKAKKLAVESDGAMCVFPGDFKNKDGEPLPFIIQKSDGAFLYATTDLAAMRFRIDELKADKIIYVTDARQSLHFQMLFETAKMAGWTNDDINLMHVTFGTMLGTDGKPFKTRTGGTVKLKDLLEEAVQRATAAVEEKNPDLPAEQKKQIAKAIGIGAVKYADYSNNRNSDFIFSFDKMLAMEGNTAPYMQYAYARIKSIERKAEDNGVNTQNKLTGIKQLAFTEEAEKELAKMLIRYDQAIAVAAEECRPNYLTSYLYDLAQSFSRFYNACPVLKASSDQRAVRLLLCDLTARTIKHGLTELLGIEVVEQM
ncbi:MAG: arginine--tRNA ligase [Planctomycetales bacterium 4572_13]|nr:MAG: arginine--tRNA ligase [Planctomycetales bacterium 4572_13]